MKKIILSIIMLTMFATASLAATVSEVTYVWTAPETGSPVTHYVVQFQVNELAWVEFEGTAEESFTFANIFEYGQTYIVRVAGVDSQLRQGGWSLPSIPYTPDAGAPGIPGQPLFVEVP